MYDAYGNMINFYNPYAGLTTIDYDTVFHLYPVSTTLPAVQESPFFSGKNTYSKINYYDQSYDLTSTSVADISARITRGRVTGLIDLGVDRVNTYYDEFGRVTEVVKPGDSAASPTVSYFYRFNGVAPNMIHMVQKDGTSDGSNTYSYLNGFGRVLQVKQETVVNGSTAGFSVKDSWTYPEQYQTANGTVASFGIPIIIYRLLSKFPSKVPLRIIRAFHNLVLLIIFNKVCEIIFCADNIADRRFIQFLTQRSIVVCYF